MALLSGFLNQKCLWKKTGALDAFGQPSESEPVEIKCRWERKSGFVSGTMGFTHIPAHHKVMVDVAVSEGDSLFFDELASGVVISLETIVDVTGKEQGRICYV